MSNIFSDESAKTNHNDEVSQGLDPHVEPSLRPVTDFITIPAPLPRIDWGGPLGMLKPVTKKSRDLGDEEEEDEPEETDEEKGLTPDQVLLLGLTQKKLYLVKRAVEKGANYKKIGDQKISFFIAECFDAKIASYLLEKKVAFSDSNLWWTIFSKDNVEYLDWALKNIKSPVSEQALKVFLDLTTHSYSEEEKENLLYLFKLIQESHFRLDVGQAFRSPKISMFVVNNFHVLSKSEEDLTATEKELLFIFEHHHAQFKMCNVNMNHKIIELRFACFNAPQRWLYYQTSSPFWLPSLKSWREKCVEEIQKNNSPETASSIIRWIFTPRKYDTLLDNVPASLSHDFIKNEYKKYFALGDKQKFEWSSNLLSLDYVNQVREMFPEYASAIGERFSSFPPKNSQENTPEKRLVSDLIAQTKMNVYSSEPLEIMSKLTRLGYSLPESLGADETNIKIDFKAQDSTISHEKIAELKKQLGVTDNLHLLNHFSNIKGAWTNTEKEIFHTYYIKPTLLAKTIQKRAEFSEVKALVPVENIIDKAILETNHHNQAVKIFSFENAAAHIHRLIGPDGVLASYPLVLASFLTIQKELNYKFLLNAPDLALQWRDSKNNNLIHYLLFSAHQAHHPYRDTNNGKTLTSIEALLRKKLAPLFIEKNDVGLSPIEFITDLKIKSVIEKRLLKEMSKGVIKDRKKQDEVIIPVKKRKM